MRIQEQTLQLSHLGTFPDIISFFTIFPSRFSPQPIQEAVWKLPWASTNRSSLIPATVNRIIILAMCTIVICTFKPEPHYEGWFKSSEDSFKIIINLTFNTFPQNVLRASPPGNILWQVPFLNPPPQPIFYDSTSPTTTDALKNTILKSVSLYTVMLITCWFV